MSAITCVGEEGNVSNNLCGRGGKAMKGEKCQQ